MAGRYRGIVQRGQGWQIAFTLPDGTRCREIVRFPKSRKGEEEAFRLRAQVLAEIDRGTFDYFRFFPRSRKARKYSKVPGRFITIEQALKEYLVSKKPFLSYSSYYSYSSRVYAHLIPAFGHLTLADLTPSHVREWCLNSAMPGKTLNNTLSPLRAVFLDAFEDEMIDRNPLARIPAFPVLRREPDPFTAKEIELTLSALGNLSTAAQVYFMFAFGSGLRTSELLALLWSDIDLDRAAVVVTKAKVKGRIKEPKTSSGRRIVDLQPLARRAIELNRECRNSRAEVFVDDRTGMPWRSGQSLRKGFWYRALESAGVRRRNPYQTRHTFASHLLSAGANPMYVAEQMGHRDWGMIRSVYGRWLGGGHSLVPGEPRGSQVERYSQPD